MTTKAIADTFTHSFIPFVLICVCPGARQQRGIILSSFQPLYLSYEEFYFSLPGSTFVIQSFVWPVNKH